MGGLFDCTDLDTKLIEAHYNRAISYLRLGELELATKAAQTALMINQGYPPALSILDLIKQEYWTNGLTSIKENKIDRGIFAFQCAVNIDPAFTDAYFQLACLYLKKNELEAAEKTAKKILRLNSGSVSAHELMEQITDAYCIRGRVALKRSRLMGAKAAVDEALRLDSNYELAHELMEQIKWSYYNQGVTFLEQNQYNKAIVSFEDALAIDSCFTEAHCGIVRTYLTQRSLASAEEVLRERLDLNSAPARELLKKIKDAYYNSGVLYLGQGKFADAEKAIKEVLRFDSSGEMLLKIKNMYCDQGRVYLNSGEYDFARKTVEGALRIDSDYGVARKLSEEIKHAYCDGGFNFLGRRWYNKAIASFESVLAMDPDFTKAHCGIACVCLGRGKYTDAKKAIDQILRLEPTSPYLEDIKHAYYKQGHTYLTQGKLVDAEKAANGVLSFDSNSARELLKKIKDAYYNSGVLYLGQGKFADAEKAIKEVLRFDSSGEMLLKIKNMYCNQGLAYLSQGKYDLVEKTVKEVLILDSSYEPARDLLETIRDVYCEHGRIYLKQGNLEAGEKAANEALRLDSSYENARQLLMEIKHTYKARGTIFLNNRRYEQANSDFQKAKAINVSFTETGLVKAYCRLGNFYLRCNELDNAHAVIAEILRLDPDYESSYELLENLKYAYCNHGRVCLNQGKLEDAEKAVSVALYLDRYSWSARELLKDLKQVYYNCVIDFLNEDRYDAAIASFERLLTIDSNFAEVECLDVLSYLAQGDLAAAEERIREVLEIGPEDYRFDSDDDFASVLLRKIKHVYYDLGVTFLEENQYNEAITNFENAIAIDVNFTEAYDGLRDAYLGFEVVFLAELDVEKDSAEIDIMAQVKEVGSCPNRLISTIMVY